MAFLAVTACALLCLPSGAQAATGDLLLVANTGVSDFGEVTNPRHRPAISGDGRFIAYVAKGSLGENGDPLFLRDMRRGEPALVVQPSEKRVFAGFSSSSPVLSASGRYLAFASENPDISNEDIDYAHSFIPVRDVFVSDRATGKITLVSRRSGPRGAPANSASSLPSISADGRYVAYGTESSNLAPGPRLVVGGVYRRDLRTEENSLISGVPGMDYARPSSFSPDLSDDGRRVAFGFQYSRTPYDPDNPPRDIFKWLRARTNQIMLADPAWGHPRLVSRANGARSAIGNEDSREASVSGSGRFVAFTSPATNLVAGDRNGVEDVFVRDVLLGRTTLISRVGDRGALGDGNSGRPSISSSGRFVAFQSRAGNLAPADPDGDPDVFVKDLWSGRLLLASRALGGEASNGSSAVPVISAGGRYVAFGSTASNLVPEDTGDDLSFYRFQVLP